MNGVVRTMMSRRGCGSSSDSPILVAIGTSSTAAMVCEMLIPVSFPLGLPWILPNCLSRCDTHKVAITSAKAEKMSKMLYSPMPSTNRSNTWSSSSSRPDDRVALPSAIPPMARKTMLQWNEWKSSCQSQLYAPVTHVYEQSTKTRCSSGALAHL